MQTRYNQLYFVNILLNATIYIFIIEYIYSINNITLIHIHKITIYDYQVIIKRFQMMISFSFLFLLFENYFLLKCIVFFPSEANLYFRPNLIECKIQSTFTLFGWFWNSILNKQKINWFDFINFLELFATLTVLNYTINFL